MVALSRIGLLAYGIESTPGTAVAPTLPGNANILIYEPNFGHAGQITPRNPVHRTLSKPSSVVGSFAVKFSFKVELKGSGTAGTAPAIGPLLQACGCTVTNVVSTSDTYKPDDQNFGGGSSNPYTLTLDFYQNDRRHRMIGAMGNAKIVCRLGEPAFIEFVFDGVLDPTDPLTDDAVSDVAAITYEATKPQPFMGSNIATFFSTNPMVTQFDFDFGNTVSVIPSANSPNGLAHARVVDRNASGSFDAEAIANATFANTGHGRWKSGTTGAMSVAIGSSGGNIATMTSSAIQIVDLPTVDRDGINTDNHSFIVTSAPDLDQEWAIAFT